MAPWKLSRAAVSFSWRRLAGVQDLYRSLSRHGVDHHLSRQFMGDQRLQTRSQTRRRFLSRLRASIVRTIKTLIQRQPRCPSRLDGRQTDRAELKSF